MGGADTLSPHTPSPRFMMMTDPERIDALLDMVDPDRVANVGRGPELAVLGLAVAKPRGGYQPTNAGWVMIGNRGRAFQPQK